jgi:peptidyl-prolyl cis-trans isomerase D
MFEFIRSHSRLALGVMVLLIFPSFIFFGIQGYSRFTDGANATVAKVDGHAITQAEWDAAHRNAIERIRQQSPNVDAKLLESPAVKRQTLDGLIRERVLLSTARDEHLVPDDNRLQRLFVSDPQFAQLRNPDGSVNREMLAAQGMSSEMFAQQLRQEFGMQQVLSAVTQSAFASAATAAPSLDALLQQREIQLQRFDAADYKSKVSPSDADIDAYYKAHQRDFNAPEQATIDYVQLSVDDLMKSVNVPEEDLHRYYEENISRYTTAEQRRASHILVKVEPEDSAAKKEVAKKRAEELLAEVRKNPAAFADIARKNSQDPGSAAQGGDLDFFGRGMMAKPFEDAVFAMKPGEISDVIQTDFGYHIIQLTAVRGGTKKPFDEVRASIEAEVRKSLAQKKFTDVAEQFTNTVYEQSDSLQPVIDKLKLVKHTATVERTPMPGASGALASQKLLDAVFSADSIRTKRNTDAIEVGPSQLVSARIVNYAAAHTRPLAEVKDKVRERVVEVQASALAHKEGQARLAEVRKAPDTELPVKLTVSRAHTQNQPKLLIDDVLAADATRLPQPLGVDLGEPGYVVVRVTKVLGRDAPPGGDALLREQYTQAWAKAEGAAYLDALKTRMKVEIKEPAIAAAASAATP